MRLLISAAVAAAILIAGPATAQVCVPAEVAVDRAREQYPDTSVWRTLTGDQAVAFMERWNAEPPVSRVAADKVIMIQKAGAPNLLLVFSKDGCMNPMQGWMKKALAEKWLDSPT